MDKIYRMIPVIDEETPFNIDDYDEASDSRDYSEIFSGTPLDAEFYQNFILKASGLGPCDYVSNPLSWPICSQRLAGIIISECGDDLQSSDALVLNQDGLPLSFKVLNLLRRIDCFSMDKGEVRLDTSPSGQKYVSAVYNWVLEADKIPQDVFLFRVPLMESVVFIRKALADKILAEDIRGVGFVDDVTLI